MEQQSIEPEIDIELSNDPEEALRELCDIQYNQCYREAIETFKNMAPKEIIKIFQIKEQSHNIDYEDYKSKESTSYEEKLKMLMDSFEVDAYRDAGKAILKLGTVN